MKNIKTFVILSGLLIVLSISIIIGISFALPEGIENVTTLTKNKIQTIRNTKNTSLTGRDTNNIYYVSNSGNDDNDGKTPDTAWKTIKKVQTVLDVNGGIPDGSTILFNRGDIFRGQLTVYKSDILLGAYGDEEKNKPKIYASPYDGTKTGEWVEVKNNIWKYTIDGNDQIFKKDVGQIWFFCNHSNSTCNRTTTMGDIHYALAQKKMTYFNVEENEDMLVELLTNDLDFYHMGHNSNNGSGDFKKDGGAIYVYSTSNPATRFDEIEFNVGGNTIGYNNTYGMDLQVDNLEVRYAGKHGIGGGTTSNLYVTNCELSFIGGMVQKYDYEGLWPVRLGNAVEVYGSVMDKTVTRNTGSTTYKVKKGLYVYNTYVYEIYDAGLTFQYTANVNNYSPVERVEFDNNVVEYCSYNIEYWNNYKPGDGAVNDITYNIDNTYLNKIYFTNNIFRFAGMGFTETRPEHGYEALIKAWDGGDDSYSHNRIKSGGEFIIENNYFDTTGKLKDNQGNDVEIWMLHITAHNQESMPTIRNNKFFNYNGKNLGQVMSTDSLNWQKRVIEYDTELNYDNYLLKNNEFYAYNETSKPTGVRNGTTGDNTWTLDLNKHTLRISGTGAMADYTESDLPEWYQYAKYIHTLIIDEDVTAIGKYSFYNLKYLSNIVINAKSLKNMTWNNNMFTDAGTCTTGITVEFGSNVEKIPDFLFFPTNISQTVPYITKMDIKGDKITYIGAYSLSYIKITELKIPDSVTTIGKYALSGASALKVLAVSNNVVDIPEGFIKNAKTLETLILGKKTVSCAKESFAGLKMLDTLIVPNELFTIPTEENVNAFTTFNTKTKLRIIGSTNMANYVSLINAQASNSAIYIDLINYRPVIYGDSNTFYATYTEAYINEDTTFEAKALSTADVNVTGAKYRYIDNQGHAHYMKGVHLSDNTISNIQMDVELTGNITNEVSKSIDDQNIVFLGNSLLVGYGNHGMASTTTKDDYYYYVTKYLKSLNGNIKTIKYGANTWEDYSSSESRNNETENFINYIKNNKNSNRVGTIFLQLGDNVNEDSKRVTFETDITYMINRLKEEFPDATIYYVFGRYNVATNKNIIERVVQNTSIKYIDIGTLFTENKKSFRDVTPTLYSRYTSFIGDKYLDSTNTRRFVESQGVGTHPGNYGFIAIADKIITYLKNDDYSIADAITSDSYTIESMNIKSSPVNKKLTKDTFLSNVSSDREIRIYDRSDALVNTNDRIGTGYKVVSGNSTYHVILKGDVNGDGQITLSDVSMLYNHYRGKITLTDYYLEAGKISNKSTVTLSDNARLYNYYKGKITTLG